MNKYAKVNGFLHNALVFCLSASTAALAATKDSGNKSDPPHAMKIEKRPFGKMPDGTTVDLYTLRNNHGAVVKIVTYGAIITEIHTLDRKGKPANIVLGFDNL